MNRLLFVVAALALLALAGCNQGGEAAPKIDPATAKAQPGANTPPAETTSSASSTAMRSEKEGR